MGTMLCFLFVLSCYTAVIAGSASHSLWALMTLVTGETSFPEFTVVMMLDDIQVGYYDSNDHQLLEKGHNEPDTMDRKAPQANIRLLFQSMFNDMKTRSSNLQRYFNSTDGIHVQQRVAGCEVNDKGEPAFAMASDSFDGIVADGMSFNMTHHTYYTGEPRLPWGEIELNFVKMQIQHFHLPQCVHGLNIYLEREKSFVTRRVRPRVRLIQKAVAGGVRVSCLAFGFYPRHINLTLLRDGQPIADQDLTGGEVLPNGDRTYQLRKTLEVRTKELTEKHNYTCTVSHLSLDNKLDVSWVPPLAGVRDGRLSLLVPLVVMGISLLCVFICIKKKRSATSSKTLSPLSNVNEAVEQISLSSEEREN